MKINYAKRKKLPIMECTKYAARLHIFIYLILFMVLWLVLFYWNQEKGIIKKCTWYYVFGYWNSRYWKFFLSIFAFFSIFTLKIGLTFLSFLLLVKIFETKILFYENFNFTIKICQKMTNFLKLLNIWSQID